MPSLTNWTVDYGRGPIACKIPHAWRQDVDVRWEGPATYRTSVDVPAEGAYLLFHGVSYQARVRIDGVEAATHRGMWDAFSVSLARHAGRRVAVEVEVVKNGGPTYPVRSVASGFLPYVFHTFGGIYREVELVRGESDPLAAAPPAPPTRVAVRGSQILVDGKPFYVRGALTWGWYPEVGHTNPDEETVRRELETARAMGFNLIKFCLWIPSHRYLEIMREEGMEAWVELPLWDPSPNPEDQEAIFAEMEAIVRQYRRHPNIIVWTCGCELSTTTPADYRRRLVEMVQRETGCPLVKDNSGGAEMYGGDLREFGTFQDFHPYCDLHFYRPVFESLRNGPRPDRPILFGEFNDADCHRDLPRLKADSPFWASPDPSLNDRGVRWQHDLPRILSESRWAAIGAEGDDPLVAVHAELLETSRQKVAFMRKCAHEEIRAIREVAGYVVTGWRDTPISSSGFTDDWDEPRFTFETATWNGPSMLFPIPNRRPPWVPESNRPGWVDCFNLYPGQLFLRIGFHSDASQTGRLEWELARLGPDSKSEPFIEVARGAGETSTVGACTPVEAGQIAVELPEPGRYRLLARFGSCENAWLIQVWPTVPAELWQGWQLDDPAGRFHGTAFGADGDGARWVSTNSPADLADQLRDGRKIALFLEGRATRLAPWWRECVHLLEDPALDGWLRPWTSY
ncbi:MAG: glycoside hydrolase family 2 TIM barrel-domain containing protein, partial [Fimbriimonadaceae bacterium]